MQSLAALAGFANAAAAVTITVTSLADNLTPDGLVTLREAITAANTDTSVDGSAAGSGADEIVFATGPGTITLNGTQLPTITAKLRISGPGPSALVLDGARLSRILDIAADNKNSAHTVTVSGLTFRNGRSNEDGGAIRSVGPGPLYILDCVFSGNMVAGYGGAIAVRNSQIGIIGPAIEISDSVFSGNSALHGGAISIADLSLYVRGSTFLGNFTGGIAPFAGNGGAVYVGLSFFANIWASTFADNEAGDGGAIFNAGRFLALQLCTVSGNRATNDGGGISTIKPQPLPPPFEGIYSIYLGSSTATGNRADTDNDGIGRGGGLRVNGGVEMRSTIVAENRATADARSDISGAIDSSRYNVVGVDTGMTGITDGTNGNQVGTASAPIDPLLGPLQDNGGPTATHALRSGSPALDAPDPSPFSCFPSRDQRGLNRPLDGNGDGVAACDIGAYEAFVPGTQPVSFFTLTPCRAADTRTMSDGPALAGNGTRFFYVPGPEGRRDECAAWRSRSLAKASFIGVRLLQPEDQADRRSRFARLLQSCTSGAYRCRWRARRDLNTVPPGFEAWCSIRVSYGHLAR